MRDDAKPSRFIGRADELARLEAAAARADGLAGVVIVGGEAGIGKTWLLDQFAVTSRERGAEVLTGGCLEFGGQGVPFAPFVEIIRSLVATTEPARLPALLGPGRRDLARLVPEVTGRPADGVDGEELDRHAQARLFEAVLGAFERIARSAPVVLIVEDVQWADADTRDLLTFLVRHLRGSRVLVTLSIRTDDLDPGDPNARFIGELERDDGVIRIELPPLGRRELGAILATHSATQMTGDQLDDVLARSGGNPFYAVHMLEMVQGGQPELPPRLRDVLLVRLNRLSPVAQEVVRAAAAAGMAFDDDLLAAVTGAPGREVADALREAIEAGVLVADRGSRRLAGYTFRHALLREVAYEQLLAGERMRLHARFARVLMDRRRRGVPVTAAALAYHLESARDDGRALPALIEAGAEAERAFAFAVARRHYERALELWDRTGASPEAAGMDLPGLLERAAECALLTGAYDRAIELGRRAVATLEMTDPVDPVRLGMLHERLRWYFWEAGDDGQAETAVAEALRLIPAEPPSAARARALGQAAGLRMFAGNLEVASAMAAEAVTMAMAVHAPGEEAFARGVLGWCQAVSGDVDRGLSTYRDGLAIADRLRGAEGIALGHTNHAALLDRVGRTEASLEAAFAGITIVERLGVNRTYGGILIGHATKALFDLGRWDEAATMADRGLDLDPVGLSAIWLHVNHARLDTNRGSYADAAEHLKQAHALGPTVGRSGTYAIALLAAEADLARWKGQLEDVRAAVTSGAESIMAGRPLDPALGWLAAVGLRAEADAAIGAVVLHDSAAIAMATERGGQIVDVVRRMSGVAAGPADGRREAILALCRAEAGRLLRRPDASDPDDWDDVARRWEALRRPYPAAYALLRAAEAELGRRGSRERIGQHLRSAHSITVRLGATPLRDEIVILARHARIDLGDTSQPQAARDGIGLTQRESEVVRLVAAGWSNQQIADALFITRKTASVHVSNIMAKFGASNRVEAAAVAHRLGLAGEVRSSP